MRLAGHVAQWERGQVYTRFLWGNLRERQPLGRPRCRREDNIKLYLQQLGCGDLD